jgi:hypothetical protein
MLGICAPSAGFVYREVFAVLWRGNPPDDLEAVLPLLA